MIYGYFSHSPWWNAPDCAVKLRILVELAKPSCSNPSTIRCSGKGDA